MRPGVTGGSAFQPCLLLGALHPLATAALFVIAGLIGLCTMVLGVLPPCPQFLLYVIHSSERDLPSPTNSAMQHG